MYRKLFWLYSFIIFAGVLSVAYFWQGILYSLMVLIPLFCLGIYDILQVERNILRNYPVLGHFRYLLIRVRPQIQQYFIETNQSGTPFSDEIRNLIYQRSEGITDTLPFGTQRNVYSDGYESVNHSLAPQKVDRSEARIMIGNHQCSQPYSASRLNISAMSFGAISKNAVRALNRGAKLGNFAHNTGEGGLSPYHLQEGGDIIWQIGTGYFGCRGANGQFDLAKFSEKSQHPAVKMIEIKLSQGAKPAHGGILPAAKVSQEIAEIRGLAAHEDAISPPAHSTFSSPRGLLEFVQTLREAATGKPVGFKLCIGHRREFIAICKAMLETQIFPDFITIDGSEGGTGAAPVEFVDFIGTPLNDALVFAQNCLVGMNLRDKLKIICSGKITSGFDMLSKIAMGADLCNAARAMLFSLGCVQSLRCNSNRCPTGITTQDPKLMYALDIDDKAPKVANYHRQTIESFLEVLGATGCKTVKEMHPGYVYRRLDHSTVKHFDEIYQFLQPGELIAGNIPESMRRAWQEANIERF
ncbi:MAG: FMN-binding glutamate synthase family protein [Legionellales bacterium]|nr:FMN-binding glutamate synthase family protein [Legionellales bacterium]